MTASVKDNLSWNQRLALRKLQDPKYTIKRLDKGAAIVIEDTT